MTTTAITITAQSSQACEKTREDQNFKLVIAPS